jgi:hypothetical protein
MTYQTRSSGQDKTAAKRWIYFWPTGLDELDELGSELCPSAPHFRLLPFSRRAIDLRLGWALIRPESARALQLHAFPHIFTLQCGYGWSKVRAEIDFRSVSVLHPLSVPPNGCARITRQYPEAPRAATHAVRRYNSFVPVEWGISSRHLHADFGRGLFNHGQTRFRWAFGPWLLFTRWQHLSGLVKLASWRRPHLWNSNFVRTCKLPATCMPLAIGRRQMKKRSLVQMQ